MPLQLPDAALAVTAAAPACVAGAVPESGVRQLLPMTRVDREALLLPIKGLSPHVSFLSLNNSNKQKGMPCSPLVQRAPAQVLLRC